MFEELNFKDINKEYRSHFNYDRVDRVMLEILWWHFVLVSLGAFLIYFFQPALHYPGPFSWRVLSGGNVIAVLIFGLAFALIPTLLHNKLQNHFIFRIAVTLALCCFSFQIVFVSGGSSEAYLHLFGVLAALILYYDYRLMWLVLLAIVCHRLLLNFFAPSWASIYTGVNNHIALILHTFFALSAVVFASMIASAGRESVKAIVEANKFMTNRIKEI